MLQVQHLSKRYGKSEAVRNVNFTAKSGQITVLLGPNGAGKSTTIKCMIGLLKHEGDVLIGGYPAKSLEAKRLCAYVPETPALFDMLTVDEHLSYIAKAYEISGYEVFAESMLERFDLIDKRDKLGKELSKGMQQKVSICCALLTSPKLVFFDEPMIGLDPKAIRELKLLMGELKAQGACIIVSTHILESMDELWDNALIMKNGEVLMQTTRDQLKQSAETLADVFFEVTEG
jgi:ABC-2 type transport system ATP-binding protein